MTTRKLCGILLCICCLFLIRCTGQKTLPLEIAGKWTTDNPSYKTEYIDISSQAVSFGSESSGAFTYTVKKVKKEKGAMHGAIMYKIYCVDASGVENLFTMVYNPADGGTLRQKSTQDTVWKRNKK